MSFYNNFVPFLLLKKVYDELFNYPTSIHINYLWNLGFISGIFLGLQILTGFFLTLFYVPHIDYAYDCVQYIMRDVSYGWFIRYMHLNGASFFFILVYGHILKGIFYASYKYPRILVWYTGIVIYILMMASAFLGYVLPWGQMSYWAAVVITNLFSVIPILGDSFVFWLWGGFSVNAATLNRFFSLHYILPFVLLVLVIAHLYFLHQGGSSNPLSSHSLIKINFSPYYFAKDLFGLLVIFFFFIFFICFIPEFLNHTDNYIEANPMVTPPNIVPEWYFLPMYGILKTILNKEYGVIFMFASILVFLTLPLLDTDLIKGNYFKSINKKDFYFFFFNFLFLGYIGLQLPVYPYLQVGTICSHLHFSYFFLIWVNNNYYLNLPK